MESRKNYGIQILKDPSYHSVSSGNAVEKSTKDTIDYSIFSALFIAVGYIVAQAR